MSVQPVSTETEISSKEQILHLDSSRSVKGSPAKHQIYSSDFGLEVMISFVTAIFQCTPFQKLIRLSFCSNSFICMVLLKNNT